MALLNTCFTKIRIGLPTCFMFMASILLIQPHTALSTDNSREACQNILRDSLETIWTGGEFSPELKRRQQTMQKMLADGEVAGAELVPMMETAWKDIIDSRQTSRYIMKTLPDRINKLLTPHMDWEAVREIMWRALSSPIRKENPVHIKVGTLAPPGTPWLNVPETLVFPEIERLSEGKIITKIYGGGVMGEDTEILKKMADDRLDCCGCTALGVLEACPEASALLLPGLFNNYAEVDYICDKFRKRLDEGFEKQGYVLWAIIDTGFFYIFSKNKVNNLEELRRQNVITWFGIIETTLFDELEIKPIPLAVPDIIAALNTGQVDVNVAPAAWMLGMQAYQYSNFYLNPPLVYSPAAVIVSTRTMDRIAAQTGRSAVFARNMMEVLAAEWNTMEPEWKRQIRLYEERSFKAFETKCGMKSITLPPEDRQVIDQASKAVQQKLAGSVFPEDLIEDMQKALENYRAKH